MQEQINQSNVVHLVSINNSRAQSKDPVKHKKAQYMLSRVFQNV